MKIAIAYAERDGASWPDDGYAAAMEARLVEGGHSVERIVVPLASRRSPQEQALACQLMPTDAYADELWTLNFPACLLPHRVRRVWFTRAEPFGDDARAPSAALAPLLTGTASIRVACDALRRRLGLPEDGVEIGLPPAPLRENASPAAVRTGAGLLLVADTPAVEPGSKDAEHRWGKDLRSAGVTSFTEVVARNDDAASQRNALASASAVLIREDAIARLFDHALLAVRMGTPVLLLGDDEHPVVWRPKGSQQDATARPVPFHEIADVQSRWLDEEIARACARLDAETQATR